MVTLNITETSAHAIPVSVAIWNTGAAAVAADSVVVGVAAVGALGGVFAPWKIVPGEDGRNGEG
jgi:hypothetical protein